MTLTTQTLPVTVTNGRTELTFSLDATVGPKLSSLVDDDGVRTVTMEPCADLGASITAPDGEEVEDVNGCLWVLRAADANGNTYTITPATAAFYQVYDTVTMANGDEATIIEYRGITSRGPDADKFWVRVAAIVPNSGDGIRWSGWFGRESGSSLFVYEFVYPAINLTSYAGGAGDFITQAYRQRLLTSNATAFLDGTYAVNRSVGQLAKRNILGSRERLYGHPGPGMHMPFWATIAGNPAHAATYRACAMVYARDQDGHNAYFKRFRWRVLSDGSAKVTMRCHFAHMPRRSAEFGLRTEVSPDGPLRLHSRAFDNSGGPTWSPVLETFEAADNNWWYDCCAKYRASFQANTPTFLPTRSQIGISPIKRGGLLATSLHGEPTRRDFSRGNWRNHEIDWYPVFKAWLEGQSDFPVAGRLVYHRQTASERNWGGLSQPNRDLDTFVSILRETIATLNENGWRNSIYSIWVENLLSDPRWGWDEHEFRDSAYVVNELGQDEVRDLTFVVNGEETRRDYAVRVQQEREAWKRGVQEAVTRLARELEIGAIYLDVFGAAAKPSSVHQAIEPWGHNQWVAAEREAIARIKQSLGDEFVCLVESQAEGLTNIDSGADSLTPRPFLHLSWEPLYEQVLAIIGGAGPAVSALTDPPIQMRDPNPPMWQCVHNIDQPSYALNIVSSLAYHENSDLLASGGTDDDDWLSANCFAHAANWIVGHKPMAWEERTNIEGYTPIVDRAGTARSTNPFSANALDTGGVGTTFMSFFRDLYRAQGALAGKYLIDGQMQRPLQVDYADPQVQMQNNPGKDLPTAVQIPGLIPFIISSTFTYYPIGVQDVFFSFQNINNRVPAVLHTVWKSDLDDSIGVILVNWTGAPADWEGTVDPTLYGLASGVTVTRKRLGVADAVLGPASGTFTIRSDATTGGNVYIGHLPARSITVLVLSN